MTTQADDTQGELRALRRAPLAAEGTAEAAREGGLFGVGATRVSKARRR